MDPASLRVAIASDHAGFELKRRLVEKIKELGLSVEDFGPHTPDPVDYPDFAAKVAEAVSKGRVDRGIVICGTGVGSSIVANKFPGVYCALCHDTYSARQAREHVDANMLALGGRVVGPELAAEIVEVFLKAQFSGDERHRRRVGKLREIERRNLRVEGVKRVAEAGGG